jgi:2'-5' RNA ligase
MRLFVALEIDEDVRRAAEDVIGMLRRKLARLAGAESVKWVPPRNLHVTLRFIGFVDEATASAVREALAPPIAVPAFAVMYSGAGAFPPSGSPRVLWIGITAGEAPMRELAAEVERRLSQAGLAGGPGASPFHPHLTVGRLRQPVAGAGRAIREILREVGGIGTSAVSQITLFESRLSPKGPDYTPVLRSALAGGRES